MSASPAAQALGLLLLSGRVQVDSLRPPEFAKCIDRGMSKLHSRGWPVRRNARRWVLSPAARAAALRDGGVDWAAQAVAGIAIDRERELIELLGDGDGSH